MFNNCSTRSRKIDSIIIHCFVGQVTAKRGTEVFRNPQKKASANWVVGYDGSVDNCIPEEYRAWTTGGTDSAGKVIYNHGWSGAMYDHRSVTIEVASDTTYPYAITDKAYNALISLCVDICKRNEIKQMLWKNDQSLIGDATKQNVVVHRWFANKSCPGDYIFNRLGAICDEVNARLNGGEECTCHCGCGCCVGEAQDFNVGDAVMLTSDAVVYGQTYKFSNWVYNTTLYVRSVSGDRVVISTLKSGAVTGAVAAKFLVKKP